MDTFRQSIFRFIKDWSLITHGDRVLVACSGGVDSVALLHFLASHRDRMEIEVAAIHVDHMLREKSRQQMVLLLKGYVQHMAFLFRWQCPSS